MGDDELLPCPFCGGKPVHEEHVIGWYVQCEKCECGTKSFPTSKEAIEAWNTRTPTAEVEKIVRRAVELAREGIGTESLHNDYDYTTDKILDEILKELGEK